MMSYAFKPKRFWKSFAFYYPASVKGWFMTAVLIALGIFIFITIDSKSESVTDTLITFSPWLVTILMIYDLLCFRLGKFPSWWEKHTKHRHVLHKQ